MRLRLIAIAAAVVGLLGGTVSAAASDESNSPRHYYLALGDSLAYGFQQVKFDAGLAAGDVDASAFNTGYVNDFAAMLREVKHPIQTVNYGCPGETTASYFVACAWHAAAGLELHNSYSGSQEAAALAFLRRHHNQVSPITLDNGANDTTPCLSSPNPATCEATALAQVAQNLDRALGELRAAAPNAKIIVMAYYDPFAVLFPGTLLTTQALNSVIAAAAAAHGAQVADAFTPFNLALPQPQTLCERTFFCSTGDIHATDLGYRTIAQQFWAASGFGREDD